MNDELHPATRLVRVEGIGNEEFLEKYAAPGRIGLCGGNEVISRIIRKLQYHVTADGHRSPWSHAFVCSGQRVDRRHWVFESDLDLHHKQIRLGVQENRIDRYHDQAQYPNLAILDFGLDEAQTQVVLERGLDLLAGLSQYSLRELVGTVLSMQTTGLRRRRNLFEVEGSLYCSAMVQHCFEAVGVEFAPGVHRKNVTPHDISICPRARTAYLLVREPYSREKHSRRARVRRFLDNISA